ncbi:MAG TPA: hypothetical protein VJR24_16220 [Gemmatimonadaceae bacterium]|nr:hypothetical protein [Gemmatimonadaceae bacterium]
MREAELQATEVSFPVRPKDLADCHTGAALELIIEVQEPAPKP